MFKDYENRNLQLSLWAPNQQEVEASDLPMFALYDYVEYHTYDHLTDGFKLKWRDDFDLDKLWTFWYRHVGRSENNQAIFYPENVYVEDGNLVIKMEPEKYSREAQLTVLNN